jgi:D-threo-aldose 1-dehydrogenase
MDYNEIGNTGIHVPPVIFGTSALGNLYTALDDATKLNIVGECFAHVRKPVVFDSAGKYGAGMALEMLGKCLKKLNVKPDEVIISNKLGWIQTELTTLEPTFEQGVWHNLKNDAVQNISYDGIMTCFEQGNELLGGMYQPQLLSVHDPDEYIHQGKTQNEKDKLFNDILEAYRALADLKKQGKVKGIGIGSKDWTIIAKVAEVIQLDWVMFANSLTIMHHPPELLAFMENLHQRKISIFNSAVFHGGFLTGSNYFDYKLVTPETDKAKFVWREKFIALCLKYQLSPSVACVHFGMTPPGVIAISLNTSNPARVKDNVASVVAEVPVGFYAEMIKFGLISKDYPYIKVS